MAPSNFLSNTMVRPTYSANNSRTTPAVCDNGLALRLGGLAVAGSGVGEVARGNTCVEQPIANPQGLRGDRGIAPRTVVLHVQEGMIGFLGKPPLQQFC